ncbi:DUF6951 family protein [Desulfosporosinus metallidurans]|uniref:Putative hydrolases or acyltransferases (Alpha/beta hydrolase superfamily) n=1 Tax=Desulfosporosinus metallidurans TaxID=1888891 RepID=A0A1Q8QFV0_9FIRM|nr:hypothetical protein [Desulfosporosinus metallidurans]OLN26152.1 putative hydrolases or acyltransferases (alpha/beta hydrolase superfamily) [Desulfosporosinus metallidurans]
MATGVIHCGICGFTINVKAVSDSDQNVKLEINSDCPNYQKIAKELTELNAYKEVFNKLHMGRVYEVFAKYSPHPSCPGVSGILKTVEVAAGLALSQNVSMNITKE